MAPCTMERTERIGQVEVSQYRTWAAFGGGFEVVARNGSEIERIHTRSLPMADETFAMLVGKYSGHQIALSQADLDRLERARDEYQEARELYEFASGR